jgi:hypothetical protein
MVYKLEMFFPMVISVSKELFFIALPPPTLDEKEPPPPATISEESERY